MEERKLKRRVQKARSVAVADGLDPGDPVEDLRRRGIVIVEGAGFGACGEDTRVIRPADDDPDTARRAQGQHRHERLLLQQRVAARKKEKIEIAPFREPLAGLPFVDAGTEGPDHALIAQLHQRLVSARHQLVQLWLQRLPRAVVEDVEIMGIENIDPVDAQPLQREFERPHHPVIGVVIDLVPRGHVEPFAEAVAPVGCRDLQ